MFMRRNPNFFSADMMTEIFTKHHTWSINTWVLVIAVISPRSDEDDATAKLLDVSVPCAKISHGVMYHAIFFKLRLVSTQDNQ